MPAATMRRSYGSDSYVSELQRGRLLSATFALVGERGYEGVTARSVSERAGVSNRTFYECFSDREDCFLAAFDHALEGLEREVRAGWESERGWTARVRAALSALLQTLDREPAVRRLVFVEALAAGPRVLARRAGVLESLAGVVDEGRENAKAPAALLGDPARSALVAEGVVGGVFGVIHARLLESSPEPLTGLLGALMATIVLPYRGGAAAARELTASAGRQGAGGAAAAREMSAPAGQRGASRSIMKGPAHPAKRALHASERGRRDAPPIAALRPLGSDSPLDHRLTVRAQGALAAVAEQPGLNNREVSEVIGLADQGQVSRIMKRLQEQGLVENTQAHAKRLARAWRVTTDGEAVIDAYRSLEQAQRTTRRGGKLVAKSERWSKHPQIVPPSVDLVGTGFRLTALTHHVLAAVVGLCDGEVIATNREVARVAGVRDEGQISRILKRLERHGLLENVRGGGRGSRGESNAWQLTWRGEGIERAARVHLGDGEPLCRGQLVAQEMRVNKTIEREAVQ
jgi:AcrR family transcriptional regulator/DNA-binding MarR family transcriptional regulator/alkylated DNA nucleotide flippase Atl1